MTTRYCGIGGNDGNSGLTWALRKLTLNGVEDTPVVAGDVIHVGPGVYRELLTCDVSGGNTYAVNTVTVTNGSTTITGAGTAFLANIAIADMFHIRLFASGNDGVANGTATFTSAAGNFQANMIGQIIQIMTRGAYVISAVAAANSITLTDPNGLGWPAAAGGLTYSVLSGQGSYEIRFITDNTNFELVRPWCGPTLTGLTYITYTPIRYIGNVTGETTDGVGGVVRITASDNDQSGTRNKIIDLNGQDYRLFQGFRLDLSAAGLQMVPLANAVHITFEDCTLNSFIGECFSLGSSSFDLTIRRCFFLAGKSHAIILWSAGTVNDIGLVVENCIFPSRFEYGSAFQVTAIGGFTVKNCYFLGGYRNVLITGALAVGQTIVVNNCIFESGREALFAIAVGEITENFNTFFANNVDRTNTAIGAGSVTHAPLMSLPLLRLGFQFSWQFGELSEWSQVRAITGANEPAEDLHGILRPVTAAKNSWGAVQFYDVERETGTVHAGSASMALHDAGRHQIFVPVANESTTISIYVYREANYAGNNPQMIVKQPGQADDVTTDAAAASQWNLLTTTLTPAADPPYVVVELASRNTAVAGNYDTFFDDLVVN
ncbi:MAG: hypothetical protein KAT00_03410 [Planctomycetes bacterium]|nr:hypothetical protein [Planctomycetota bacterium]